MCRLNPSFRIAGAPNGAIHRGPASVDQGAGRGGGLVLGNEAVSARGVRRERRQPPAGPEKRPDDALGAAAVLVLLLRSLLAPLLLVAANVLSFGATMGISALVFNHVFGFPGGDPTTVLYGFVFLVALGIDYNIFLMTRVREEALRHPTRRATLTGLAVTGGVITSAGVVLAATFSALGVLPLVPFAELGFAVAFGVLLENGYLNPGAVLFDSKRRWRATVGVDGNLRSECGNAGSIHKLGATLQDAPSCNGWTFWHHETAEGLKPIDSLRQTYLLATQP